VTLLSVSRRQTASAVSKVNFAQIASALCNVVSRVLFIFDDGFEFKKFMESGI